MKTRNFCGTEVSEIGLGTWQFGGDWGEVRDEEAMATMRAATELGVTFFDTADVYGRGRSEELIGRFLKEHCSPLFIATKVGRFPQPGWPENFGERAIRAHTEASLKRLGVERIDLLQLHCIPTEELRKGDCFEVLRSLRAEGKIAHFGASVESVAEAHLCMEHHDLSSLQIIFNIFRQKPAWTIFEEAVRRHVALIVRLPLASGLLAGKMLRTTRFPEQDHRHYNRNGEAFNVGETFAGIPFEIALEHVEELRPLVPTGLDMAEMAIRFCLDFDAVTTVIPGSKDPTQVRLNAVASELPPLRAQIHHKLRLLHNTRFAQTIRGPY